MDDVLDLLYLSMVDEAAADALPTKLAQFFGAHSCSIFVFDPSTGRPQGRLLSNHPAEVGRRYVEHFHTLDPWRLPVLQALGRPVTGEELLSERMLARTEFYNDFAKEGEMFHLLAAAVPIGPGRIAALTTHRARKVEDFGGDELARLGHLLPHFRRAAQMRALLDVRADRLIGKIIPAMLDATGHAALICDGSGRALFLNEKAGSIRVGGAPLLRSQAGSLFLSLPHADATRSLLSMVASGARGDAGGYLKIPGGFVVVTSLPPSFSELGVKPSSVLIVIRLSDPVVLAARAAQMFGLTGAEAAVAVAVAMGSSPEQAADMRSVKIGTVRTLLRRALEKTDAANLRQLSALLTNLT